MAVVLVYVPVVSISFLSRMRSLVFQHTPVDDRQSPLRGPHGLDEELCVRITQIPNIHRTQS